MFRGVDYRRLFIDVSGQLIGPIFKGIAATAVLLKMVVPETSVINYKYTPRNIPK